VSPKIRKAIMLSVLAFPGAGHIFLKYYPRAIAFAVLFSLGAGIIIINIMQKAQAVADLIVARKIPLDIFSINQRILEQPDMFSELTLNIATWGVIGIWLICILDTYGLAKKKFA